MSTLDLPGQLAVLPLAHCAGEAGPTAGPYPDRLKPILSLAAHAEAMTEISEWPGYAPTPLVSLAGMARAAGVAAIHYKHEASRFGLGSFKALGGAYAIARDAAQLLAAIDGRKSLSAIAAAAGLDPFAFNALS